MRTEKINHPVLWDVLVRVDLERGFEATIEKLEMDDKNLAPYWYGHDPYEAIRNLEEEYNARQRLLWDDQEPEKQVRSDQWVIIGVDYASQVKVIRIDLENLWKLQKLKSCWLINYDEFEGSYICADNEQFYEKMSSNATLDIRQHILNNNNY